MSVSKRSLFPFDGEYELSRDADLTISFSEGAPLKAHAQNLEQASSVLKNASEDCRHDGTLDVGDYSREAWLLLLNLVHPGRRITGPSSHECTMLEAMVRISESNPLTSRMYVCSTVMRPWHASMKLIACWTISTMGCAELWMTPGKICY